MPNYEELAKGINQPFGGVGQMQPAPGADPGFKPTLDPVLLLNAAKAVGEYFRNQITQPIQGTMDAARMGQYNVAPGQGVAPNPMNPLGATMMGIGAGWKGGLPAGATGAGMSFKQSYPTFEIYKKAMADMKIPLDEVVKQRAKGPSYHSIPATEAEYMARAGEAPVGKVGTDITPIGERTNQGYKNFMSNLAKKWDAESKGVAILDDIELSGRTVKDVSNEFWNKTYPILPEEIKAKFHKYIQRLWEGVEPGSVVAIEKGVPIKASSWKEIGEKWMDLPNNPQHLQGTERGFVALMEYGNKSIKQHFASGISKGGDWSSIKQAIDSIPRHRPGGLDTLTDLKAKFPDMPKAEFDEMMLKLSREGKISLHHHDMPGSYKGEMIKDGKTFYHAFGVKPEWR